MVVEFNPPRLTLLDADDRLIGYFAEGAVIIDRPGWPMNWIRMVVPSGRI